MIILVGYMWDDIKMDGKKQDMAPTWKKLMTNVEIDEPTSFLDHVHLRCTQRECKPNEIVKEKFSEIFEPRISAGATEKLPGWEKLHAKTVACSYDMEGLARKCVERYCELSNKKVEQLYKVSSPCLDDHQFKQEELESVGQLSEVCSQIVLKCLYLARIGGPDILWSVNKLARAATKWTQACDRRLARCISYFHHTHEFRKYCHVGNTAQHCRLGLFQDSDFAGDLVLSEVEQLFPKVGCARSKRQCLTFLQNRKLFLQTRGLRMDGLLALDIWDVVIEVLRSTNSTKTPIRLAPENWCGTQETVRAIKIRTKTPTERTNRGVDQLSNVDYVPTNTHSSHGESQLNIFEDNEAVIKMIIKGRRPTMRHVSRTHSVALDWLFDRINLEPKIQIKYVDSKNQLADMLTKGNFACNVWNHLLRLFNIMNFSMFSCSRFLSNRTQSTMSKRAPTKVESL